MTATVSGQPQQVKDHPAPAVPIPSWPFPLLSAPHPHSPTAASAAPHTSPLLHHGATLPPPSIPLQDYGKLLYLHRSTDGLILHLINLVNIEYFNTK